MDQELYLFVGTFLLSAAPSVAQVDTGRSMCHVLYDFLDSLLKDSISVNVALILPTCTAAAAAVAGGAAEAGFRAGPLKL